jgi:hypothetical protein
MPEDGYSTSWLWRDRGMPRRHVPLQDRGQRCVSVDAILGADTDKLVYASDVGASGLLMAMFGPLMFFRTSCTGSPRELQLSVIELDLKS